MNSSLEASYLFKNEMLLGFLNAEALIITYWAFHISFWQSLEQKATDLQGHTSKLLGLALQLKQED